MPTVYLNGEFLPLEQARISPLDRGFTFGDGVYEVIPVYQRRIFRLEEHLLRLQNSLEMIYISNPMSFAEWSTVLTALVDQNEGDNQSVYLQVTRGVSVRDHYFPEDIQPTVFIMSKPLLPPDVGQGIIAVTRPDIRWQWCDIKATTLLPSVLLRHEARQHGAREAILLRDGQVTEGAASNVFICQQGQIKTPAKGRHLLPGITRDLLIEILQAADLDCLEGIIDETELRAADEIWLTSSTQEILPVVTLDGAPVGDGKPGQLWRTATALYENFKKNFTAGKFQSAV